MIGWWWYRPYCQSPIAPLALINAAPHIWPPTFHNPHLHFHDRKVTHFHFYRTQVQSFATLVINPICPGDGGGQIGLTPLPCICVYLCKYTYKGVEKKLDFPQLQVWKRAVRYLPRKIISLCWKKQRSSEIPKFDKGGAIRTGSEASRTHEKW